MADGAVTNPKLAPDAVTSDKIQDSSVRPSKTSFLTFHSIASGEDGFTDDGHSSIITITGTDLSDIKASSIVIANINAGSSDPNVQIAYGTCQVFNRFDVIIDDPKLIEMAVIANNNEKENERLRRLEAQEHERQQRIMQEREKQRQKNEDNKRRHNTNLAERQKQMILSGRRDTCNYCHLHENGEWFGHSAVCPVKTGRSIEPGLRLIALEYKTGRLIELDQVTRDRLVDFAIPDETFQDVINTLLDFAITEAQRKREPS